MTALRWAAVVLTAALAGAVARGRFDAARAKREDATRQAEVAALTAQSAALVAAAREEREAAERDLVAARAALDAARARVVPVADLTPQVTTIVREAPVDCAPALAKATGLLVAQLKERDVVIARSDSAVRSYDRVAAKMALEAIRERDGRLNAEAALKRTVRHPRGLYAYGAGFLSVPQSAPDTVGVGVRLGVELRTGSRLTPFMEREWRDGQRLNVGGRVTVKIL